jgi:hypothetical protein
MTDAGITVSYRLIQTAGGALIVERERKLMWYGRE